MTDPRDAVLPGKLEPLSALLRKLSASCQGSRMEVVTTAPRMCCPRCRGFVDVVPYDHPRHGRCHMLAEHPPASA